MCRLHSLQDTSEQGGKSFGQYTQAANAIRDMSIAVELTKVWQQKEIPAQTHPTAGLALRG